MLAFILLILLVLGVLAWFQRQRIKRWIVGPTPGTGSRWISKPDNPFQLHNSTVVDVLDLKDGWVRWSTVNVTRPQADSCSLEKFRKYYRPFTSEDEAFIAKLRAR